MLGGNRWHEIKDKVEKNKSGKDNDREKRKQARRIKIEYRKEDKEQIVKREIKERQEKGK